MDRNYQKELEKKLAEWKGAGEHPSLLLHACCAPCSSYCLEYLNSYMDITVYFYNPNITSQEEYEFRREELKRLITLMPFEREVKFLEGPYDPDSFFALAQGLEDAPERGPRCVKCYTQRLTRTAKVAADEGFDYFATTLTLSPLKPAQVINSIGEKLSATVANNHPTGFPEENFNALNHQDMQTGKYQQGEKKGMYLPTDFKKNNGYKRSIELSHEYNLYRQNYCGCVYSKR